MDFETNSKSKGDSEVSIPLDYKRVDILLKEDYSKLDSERVDLLIERVAKILEISTSMIHLKKIEKESVKVTLQVPPAAAGTLIKIFNSSEGEARQLLFKEFNVSSITAHQEISLGMGSMGNKTSLEEIKKNIQSWTDSEIL